MYTNACPSHLKVGAASSSWRVKSKRLEIIPPAHLPAHVGWKIQSTTKESSLSHMVTLSLLLQSRWWSQRWWSQRWTSWRRHVSSMTKKEDITMLRSTPSSPINNVSIVLAGGILCLHDDVLSLWPCLIRIFVMTVGVLWVFYLQWHQLPRWVLLLYLPLLVILRLST